LNRISLVIAIAPLLAVAPLLITGGCAKAPPTAGASGGPPPVAVRVVPATASDVPLEIAAIGNVEAIASVDVKSRITAPVLRVNFQEGQDVQKGELLFELDPETYHRQMTEVEANILKDAATEKQSAANIEKDQATLNNLQTLAERGTKLLKEGIFSREQNDLAVSNADAAKASIDADRAALESAKATEAADRSRLAQMKLSLSYTSIYAPISGRAGAIQVKQGNLAKENDTTLVTLLQVSPIYVSFSVPENLLPEVRRYDATKPLIVTAVSADNSVNTGTLRFIDNTVDATTGTIKLKAAFENSHRNLWPGQFVNVRAQLSVEHGRVLIPSQTVQTGPDGKYVWVLKSDATAVMRPVQVLRNFTPSGHPEQAVIGSGLTAGDSVVSEGQLRLAPGSHVRILKPNASMPS
jgi:multidrug efflux system membrane fusion protein